MRPLVICALVLSACALPSTADQAVETPAVWVRSHNRSAADVYLLCGDRDARWLGTVEARGAGAISLPKTRPYCARGLDFFLVLHASQRGYWVGPIRFAGRGHLELVIEKYAGLSSARAIPGQSMTHGRAEVVGR